jgi:F0F1-type ATP synthase assembly protein I
VADAARRAAEEGRKDAAEMERSVAELQERAQRLRAGQEAREERAARQSITGSATGKSLGAGLSAAYALIGAPLVGYGLGYLADRGTDSNVFGLVGFCVGAVAAVAYAVRVLNRQ